MPLSELLGQETASQTLERALASGKVHHAYRFEGPRGTGKTTAALLLAQALLCETEPNRGCGACHICRRVITFTREAPHVPQHPDVIWIGQGVYPPHLIDGASETSGISVAQIRKILLPRVALTPHEGRCLVVIVSDADKLNPSSANAMLKTLEEPRSGVHFILTTSRPRTLLDTILSRTLKVRFGPLPPPALATLFEREGLAPAVLSLCQGSLERARLLSEPASHEGREAFVTALDSAVREGAIREGGAAAALAFADERPDAREDLVDLLGHVATCYAERARESSEPLLWATRHRVVSESLKMITRNGSPALVLEAMVTRLINTQ